MTTSTYFGTWNSCGGGVRASFRTSQSSETLLHIRACAITDALPIAHARDAHHHYRLHLQCMVTNLDTNEWGMFARVIYTRGERGVRLGKYPHFKTVVGEVYY